MRPGGKEGYGYLVEFGTEIVGDDTTPIPEDGFYIITSKAASGSAFPSADAGIEDGEDVGVNDLVYLTTDVTPATDDNVKPVNLTFLSFCRDIESSASKQKFDDSTQADIKSGIRSYSESALSEKTGSISGFYETDSAAQELLENRFAIVIKDDGTNVTRKPIRTGIFQFMMSRRETTEVGETEVWEYLPMIVDQLTQQKPMEGTQEFNFNYTVDGKNHPAVYKRTISA